MRTPLQSCVVVLRQALVKIGRSPKLSASEISRMVDSLHLVVTQITFVESFIEDLLSVNLLAEGVF